MLDKFRSWSGKYYYNGTAVQYAAVPPKTSIVEVDQRDRLKKNHKIGFKQRMKIYDAITFQHFEAASRNDLFHCFLTATFLKGHVPDNPNAVFSGFADKLKKQGFSSIVWTRELTKVGTVHYHFTTVGPKKPVNAKAGWSINKCWCDSRGYYSGNGIRSSIDPFTGKSRMVISSLWSARQYVAKYISKANGGYRCLKCGVLNLKSDNPCVKCGDRVSDVREGDQSKIKGRLYAVSNNLLKPPLGYESALDVCFIPQFNNGKDVKRYDFATVGEVRVEYSAYVYSEIEKIVQRRQSEMNERRQKQLNKSNYNVLDQTRLESFW